MGNIINNEETKKLKKEMQDADPRAIKVETDFLEQLNLFYSKEMEYDDKELNDLLLQTTTVEPPAHFYNVPTFRASSVSHCSLELYLLNLGHRERNRNDLLPYHRRWLRNAHAVHDATQKDLLYMGKYLDNPKFTVATIRGKLAWEENIRTYKVVDHNGVTFGIEGMGDGILRYEGAFVGFEFKTKSTTIGTVGRFKMKDIYEGHKIQIITYSILFGIDEFIVMYESLAKDGWNKYADAKPDIRVFYYKVTDADRKEVLDKLSSIVGAVDKLEPPGPELDKCLLCSMKDVCEWGHPPVEEVPEIPDGLGEGLIDG